MAGKLKNKYNVIDLFAGVGGMSCGFKKAGFNILSANEIDSEIAQTYIKNHPKTKVISKDISDTKFSELISSKKMIVDVVVGGPPCQGFSMAGKRIRSNGIFKNDPRNHLFEEFGRIVKESNPKIFVMENVPAILNLHNGKVKDRIISMFEEIGYKVQVKVLLAADYGVPQLRKRAVFIGNRINIDPKILFPEKTHGKECHKKYVSIHESIFDLPFIGASGGDFMLSYDKKPASSYQKERRNKSKVLYNHIATSHDKRIINILKKIKEGCGMSSLPNNLKTKSVHSGAFGRMDRNRPSYTITTRFDTPSVGRVTHPVLNRSITPREAARLQSFDDDFVFYGSKSSIGKQIGNAVPPLFALAIAKKILNFL